MPENQLKTFLDEADVEYMCLSHPPAFTAQELAHHVRIAGDRDFVDLADEQAFQDRFPDCEVGAMPPFGNLFGMSVYCAETLTEQPELAFAAGRHTESIHMKTRDFLNLVQPMVINQGFTRPGARKPAWLARPHRRSGNHEKSAASSMAGY